MIMGATAFETGAYKRRGAILNLHLLPVNVALRVARAADNLNQEQLCEVLGIPDRAYLSRVESGKVPVPERLMERISKYLYEGSEQNDKG